jgi:hypothetical protein
MWSFTCTSNYKWDPFEIQWWRQMCTSQNILWKYISCSCCTSKNSHVYTVLHSPSQLHLLQYASEQVGSACIKISFKQGSCCLQTGRDMATVPLQPVSLLVTSFHVFYTELNVLVALELAQAQTHDVAAVTMDSGRVRDCWGFIFCTEGIYFMSLLRNIFLKQQMSLLPTLSHKIYQFHISGDKALHLNYTSNWHGHDKSNEMWGFHSCSN